MNVAGVVVSTFNQQLIRHEYFGNPDAMLEFNVDVRTG